jgi:hypothetical protein
MSLVIAFIGASGAVMGGDMREILTRGDKTATQTLEDELYGGKIVTDGDLKKRAGELGIMLIIRDDKCKVAQWQGVLIGEVSETEGGITKKRRLYASAGGYAIAELSGTDFRLTGRGKAGSFVVLGNRITKQVAHACIRENWNNGTIHDAIRVIILCIEKASGATASVSRECTLVQTTSGTGLSDVIEQDRVR